jgi:hypothetical protein
MLDEPTANRAGAGRSVAAMCAACMAVQRRKYALKPTLGWKPHGSTGSSFAASVERRTRAVDVDQVDEFDREPKLCRELLPTVRNGTATETNRNCCGRSLSGAAVRQWGMTFRAVRLPVLALLAAASLAACSPAASVSHSAPQAKAAATAAPSDSVSPGTVPAKTACQALAAWENSSATGSVAGNASLKLTFEDTTDPLATSFALWTDDIKAGSASVNADAAKVAAECAALGVTVFPPVSPDTAAPSAPAATAPAAPATSAPAAPSMTAAQQQAVDAAQGYLDLGSGFSEAGLIKQLTSSYGSGFAMADAEFAVSYLHPDWNAQAVEAAKGYMKLGGFSRERLLQQLTSPYGGQFTQAQATYAVNAVGL